MRLKQAVAIAGTHGKTTTTSMVAALLDAGGFDPTVINGGIINAYGTNARMGASDWMVVEADEFDGTFVKLPVDVALVTNIDPEHLDHYGDFDQVREAFRQFVENVPFYGFAVMCIDHPEVQALIGRIEDRRIITYGSSPQADVRCVDLAVEGRETASPRSSATGRAARRSAIEDLTVLDAGRAQCPERHRRRSRSPHHLGISRRRHRRAASRASAASSGASPTPAPGTASTSSTITATTRSRSPRCSRRRARCRHGRVIAVVQPHRYTRLRDLFDEFCACFNDADTVIVAPVYAAGRGADRGDQPRHAGRGPAHPRPPRRARPCRPEELPAMIAGIVRARRLRRLPRRRLDQPMGLCLAGAIGETRTRGSSLPAIIAKRTLGVMDLPRETLLAELRALRPALERGGVSRMALFGSRARMDNRPDSDVDLMIDVAEGRKFSLIDLVAVAQTIEDRLGLPANIFIREGLEPDFLQVAEADELDIF